MCSWVPPTEAGAGVSRDLRGVQLFFFVSLSFFSWSRSLPSLLLALLLDSRACFFFLETRCDSRALFLVGRGR